MMDYALYFDIGNTNTKMGLRAKGGPVTTYALPTDTHGTADQFGLSLLGVLRVAGVDVGAVGICLASSVVPGMTAIVAGACQRFLGQKLVLVPEDVPVPLENRYARPHEVGADRLVGAYGARGLFPEAPSIISVDFGTATTFDCVEKNAYMGGLICPGVLSSAAALGSNTAKLPRISLEVEGREVRPGISTVTSLNHGFIFGFAAMTEGLVARLAPTLEGPALVVGTGGFARALSEVTDCFDTVWPDLVIEGLCRLHDSL